MVWYFHFFNNFLLFVVIYTAKGFSIVSEANVDQHIKASVFLYTNSEPPQNFSFKIVSKTIKYLEINVTKLKICTLKTIRC